MGKCDKLLQRARAAPASLRFEELCQLAECHGFALARQKGSHRLYKRAGEPRVMNFQDDRGKAKEYQVKQLLDVIGGGTGNREAADE
jgi:hypothetical protein